MSQQESRDPFEPISEDIISLCEGDIAVTFAALTTIACMVLHRVEKERDIVQLVRQFGAWLLQVDAALIEWSR